MHTAFSKMFGLYSPLTARMESVEVTPIERRIRTKVPQTLESLKADANLEAMNADGRTWYSDLQKTMDHFSWEMRDFGIYPSGGCAYGGGLSVMNYRFQQSAVGSLDATIYRDNIPIGKVTEYGRWNGLRGWDEVRRILVGVLTLPHDCNMGAILSYFADNIPSIPFSGEWPLPTFNTDKAGVFVTTSSLFTYTTRPRLVTPMSFDIHVASAAPKTVWVGVLTTDRKEITGTEVNLEGYEDYRVRAGFFRVPSSGHLEITPTNMEGGCVVSNVAIGL